MKVITFLPVHQAAFGIQELQLIILIIEKVPVQVTLQVF
jgi:hypothetical protein